MIGTDEERLATLEQNTEWLAQRLQRVETRMSAPAHGRQAARSPAPSPPSADPASPDAVPDAPPAPASELPADVSPDPAPDPRRPALEDVIGGRLLAWTGGLAVVVGIAFLLAIAISNDWIGEGARALLAGLGSLALLAAGVWLHERRGRTDASLAATAGGLAGLFVTVAVAGPVYGVLPAFAALVLALLAGAAATTLAVRWEARGIGALGIVGGLLAPVLAGAPATGATLSLLWIAGASGAAVLVWQRWDWLALAVFALALGQWAPWVASDASAAGVLLALVAFGALNVAAAIGFELRLPAARLRPASALVLTANAVALAAIGWFALDGLGHTAPAHAWLVALAVAHVAVGLATASTRINPDVRLLALALGVVLADVATGLLLDGPVLAGVWAISTAGFAALARVRLKARPDSDSHEKAMLGLGLGGHLLLTSIHALLQAPPADVAAGYSVADGTHAAVAGAAIAAFVAGRFVDGVTATWRIVLDAVGIAGVAYLTALSLDGALLAGALAAEAVALGTIARRHGDAVAAAGGLAMLAGALGHALVFEARPDALVAGLDDVAGAALALGAAAGAALRGARLARGWTPVSTALAATGAVTLLYLASTALVTAFQPGEAVPAADLFDVGARQLGQAALSALWAIAGLAALVAGLRRDDRPLRRGALALLLATAGKVFVFDLAALTSVYRVASFIALGLLLLVAALYWQRMRPPPLPDLRAAPRGVR